MTTWVVIPAFNEATVIYKTVESVRSLHYNLVIVDDCSSDDTESQAFKAGAHVCRHMINLGQGAALQTGITYALRAGATSIVTFDADGQHDAKEIEKVLAPVLSKRVDVTLGSRFTQGAQAANIPSSKILLLKIATFFTRMSTGLRLTDTHNGFRAFSAEAARKITIRQNRMAHASEILTEIAAHRLRYEEVPVTIRYTEYSLQKGQKMSNSINILWDSLFGVLRR